MTEEEMQKKMQFIIEKQTQFAIDMDLLREAQQRREACVAEIATLHTQSVGAQTHMDEVMAVLAKAQQRTNEKVARLTASQASTGLKMAKTDERLKHLVTILERHISKRRNRKSK